MYEFLHLRHFKALFLFMFFSLFTSYAYSSVGKEYSNYFGESYMSYYSDAIDIYSRTDTLEEQLEKLRGFKLKCQRDVFDQKKDAINYQQKLHDKFNSSNIRYTTELVQSKKKYFDHYGSRIHRYYCVSKVSIHKNSFLGLKKFASKKYRGKKSLGKCNQFKENLLNDQRLFDLTTNVKIKRNSRNEEKVISCQIDYLLFEPNVNYVDYCKDGIYELAIMAEKADLDIERLLPYHYSDTSLSLRTLGDYDRVNNDCTKINTLDTSILSRCPRLGQEQIQNKQVILKFNTKGALPKSLVVDGIKDLTLSLKAFKYDERVRDSELLCVLPFRKCSGKLIRGNINHSFFSNGGVVVDKLWQKMITPFGHQEKSLIFPLTNLYNGNRLVDLLHADDEIDILIADDVFVRSGHLKLRVSCK